MTSTLPAATPESAQTLTFVEPLPGFGDDLYSFSAIDERGLLHSLRSVLQPSVRFVLTRAAVFFPDYRPEVEAAVAPLLGGPDVDVLVMLTIGAGLRDATANLRAPIAICRSTGRAVQVVLDDESYPMRQPLVTR